MRGISPVIATVIILAVTIAIAVAVIGWITGLFGATTGGTEQLQIMPDSYIKVNDTGSYLELHITNKGGDVTIYKITVDGVGDGDLANTVIVSGDALKNTDNTITVKAGADVYLEVPLNGNAVPGTTYTVKVFTKNGNVFTASVTAKSG